jgi:hypothetical protein
MNGPKKMNDCLHLGQTPAAEPSLLRERRPATVDAFEANTLLQDAVPLSVLA